MVRRVMCRTTIHYSHIRQVVLIDRLSSVVSTKNGAVICAGQVMLTCGMCLCASMLRESFRSNCASQIEEKLANIHGVHHALVSPRGIDARSAQQRLCAHCPYPRLAGACNPAAFGRGGFVPHPSICMAYLEAGCRNRSLHMHQRRRYDSQFPY